MSRRKFLSKKRLDTARDDSRKSRLLKAGGTALAFGAGAVFIFIVFQFTTNIIWPMVDFILRLFGI